MKLYILFIFCLTIISSVFCQRENEFVGALRTSDNQIISYKIHFRETENGIIEGESQTDFYGSENTTSKIIGTIDKKEHKLSFKEVSNIESTSNKDKTTFCFINVENLNIRKANKKRIIHGKFEGFYDDAVPCAKGTIYLVNQDLLDELNLDNDSLKKIDSLFRKSMLENKVRTLRGSDQLSIEWETDNVIFDVWDGYKEDNDSISIYFNDKLIVENLEIKKEKKTIKIPFQEDEGIMKIVALNEGKEVTNTVNFLLKNDIKAELFISILKKHESVTVKFIRK